MTFKAGLFTALVAICLPVSGYAEDLGNNLSPAAPLISQQGSSDNGFRWAPAFNESMRFLLVQHGLRLAFQPGTRSRLGGPFFKDYAASLNAIHGWGDKDPWIINYIGHPMQGSIASRIQIQNDPAAAGVEFGTSPEYWRSRFKAFIWNTAYSTQFEVGPISESSIGNVGQRKGTAGYVDFVMTPAGGFAWTLAEDWLDKRFIERWEANTNSVGKRTFYRVALNPARAIANMLRGKGPWHREGRALQAPIGGVSQGGY